MKGREGERVRKGRNGVSPMEMQTRRPVPMLELRRSLEWMHE